jgi:putative oxidoreductase
MNTKINYVGIFLLGVPMVVFGLNKFLGFANVEPPTGADAQAFLGAMFTSYLAKIVGVTEIVGGLLLFVQKTRFLGWLLLAPVVVNIAVFHLVHDMPGNGIWLLSLITFVWVGFVLKDKFSRLLN